MLAGDEMGAKISRLYGMDVYSDNGRYLGRAQDLILDLEKGEILRITLEPLSSVTRDDAKRILRERSILYKNVRSVEDVIMVSKASPVLSSEPLPEEEEAPAKPSFGFSSSFGRS
jgi:sporulation protein YlmC with PRC-barrel domain